MSYTNTIRCIDGSEWEFEDCPGPLVAPDAEGFLRVIDSDTGEDARFNMKNVVFFASKVEREEPEEEAIPAPPAQPNPAAVNYRYGESRLASGILVILTALAAAAAVAMAVYFYLWGIP